MWMDVANEVEQPEQEEDEDTVYDRNDTEESYKRNPFPPYTESHDRRGMLEYDGETRCGVWSWRPDFLQEFVTPNTFICVFILTALLHGTSWAYYTVSLSTMEKRLKISSETSGGLLAGSEIAQVALSIIFSYFTIQRRQMKFITTGAALWALSCIIIASHQMFFGSGRYALSMTKTNVDATDLIPTTTEDNSVTTVTPSGIDPALITPAYSMEHDRMMTVAQLCIRDAGFVNKSAYLDCPISDSGSSFPVSFVLISQLLSGVGTALFLSSGGPYVEDVIMPNQIPVLFGITLSLRLIGPFLGYVIGSAFLRVFISTTATPSIDEFDPRWMGAWWLGWLVIALLMCISTIILSLFPSHMAKDLLKKRSLATDTGPPFLTLSSGAVTVNAAELRVANPLPEANNFMRALMLIFNNNTILFLTLSTTFHIFVGTGYWTFFPKYLEVVFHQPAAKAAVLAGSLTVTFNAAGLLVSGILISRRLPSARQLTIWNSVITITQVIVFIIITQFGCDSGELLKGGLSPEDFHMSTLTTPIMTTPSTTITTTTTTTTTTPLITPAGTSSSFAGSTLDLSSTTALSIATTAALTVKKNIIHLLANCSSDCLCHMAPMTPVCDPSTQHAYYSPCHAGCPTAGIDGKFANCSCVLPEVELVKGFCEQHGGCFTGLVTLMILTGLSQFLGSSSVVGKMLLFYRTTEPETRSLVISVGVLIVSVLGIIPGPIIFGTVIDATCHIWETTCVGFGHCWHYHNTSLRYGLNLTAAGFLLCGAIFDILLWRKVKVKDVRLYDGDVDIPKPSSSGEAFGENSRPEPSYSR